MHKKKICFIVAVAGTANSFLMDHIECLQKRYDVHLVANFGADTGYLEEFESRGIRCHNVAIQRAIHLLDDCLALLALVKLFRKEKFACIHSVTPKAGLLTAIAGWIARIPNRLHIFTGQVWATKVGVMRGILKFMDKIIAKLDTRILVDGESQRQFLIKQGILTAENSSVPANGSIAGIKLERFVIDDNVRQEERRRFGFNDKDVVFVFLGRLNHDKGIGELFEAFNQMVVDRPNAKLLFFGTDEESYDKKVSNYPNIKRNVNYFYPGATKSPYKSLQAGDVFVLPTWREGFGVSVLEAQALGLPVITSDAYGVVDASVEGETGLRCHVNDPQSLVECMNTYYDHPLMRKSHGGAGRKRVEEQFDNTIVSQAWLEIYDKILSD